MEKRVITLAEYYNIPLEKFKELGVLNPNLTVNTNMFIDPVCLADSQFDIFSNDARITYERFYEKLYTEFKTYVAMDGKARQLAEENLIKQLKSKEIENTCLGYTNSKKGGRGVGPTLAKKMLKNAEIIFSHGADNKAIFRLVHLLTKDIGPDYISDTATKIILPHIYHFTAEMAPKLGLPLKEYKKYGQKLYLPSHPYINGPILLLPEDILNNLPLDVDIDDVFGGYNPSEEIRYRVSEYIGSIFEQCSKKSERQEHLFEYFTKHDDLIEDFLNYIMKRKSASYDFKNDPKGVYLETILRELFKFDLYNPSNKKPLEVIDETIHNFKKLIDNNNDIKREALYINDRRRPEKSWQAAFHLFISEIMRINKIETTPESQTGSGPVDFKLSYSGERILVELKLSDHQKLIEGLTNQLEKYKECTEPVKAYFVCFDVEKDYQLSLQKQTKLMQAKEDLELDTEIIWIDGRIHPSASKL